MWVNRLFLLALAGSLGTLARYGLMGLTHRVAGPSFPWGTFVVNIAGCFFAGLFWSLFEHRWPVSGEVRILILVGFMGAFTTFSSLMLESAELIRVSSWMMALANLIAQNIVGFTSLFLGMALGRVV